MKKKAFIYLINALFLLTCIAETNAQKNKNLGNTVDKITAEDISPSVDADVLAGLTRVYPIQTLGVAAGAGFTNDFNDTSFRIRGQYDRRISTPNNNAALYGTGGAAYGVVNVNNVQTKTFTAGAGIELRSPITGTGEVQWTNKLNFDYITGNRDFDSFNDKFNGFSGSFLTGVNFKVCENFFLGAETNVLSFENLTFKPDSGGDVEVDNSSFRVNKGNRINILARWRL